MSSPLADELLEFSQYQFDHIDFIDEPVNVGFEYPLESPIPAEYLKKTDKLVVG